MILIGSMVYTWAKSKEVEKREAEAKWIAAGGLANESRRFDHKETL